MYADHLEGPGSPDRGVFMGSVWGKARSTRWSHCSCPTPSELNLARLSLLTTTDDGDSWVQGLYKCMYDSHYALKEFPFDCFDIHGEGHQKLDTTKKLRLLNFLCDEAIGTEYVMGFL
ncbi:hypothetical protein Sjap_011179 [Stephania japonica]|uniref:Uncharacterized protein n=1 Tax=Stephania japonica TaxID=461633 RepID=A0AAP0JAL2_9MAGN